MSVALRLAAVVIERKDMMDISEVSGFFGLSISCTYKKAYWNARIYKSSRLCLHSRIYNIFLNADVRPLYM